MVVVSDSCMTSNFQDGAIHVTTKEGAWDKTWKGPVP